jgi:hypothetical protein
MEDDMKRSGWITGIVVIQALWTLALIALPIYLLILTRSQGIVSGPAPKESIYGLKIGAAVMALPALFAIISTFGLWKEKLWGWWLALLSNAFVLMMLIYSMTDENTLDWDMFGLAVVSAVLPILLLLPVVRKFYWHAPESA